jgi:uncharacterized lipoprotein YmbA
LNDIRSLALLGLALLWALWAAGCASTPPSVFYVLTPIPEATGRGDDIAGGGLSVGLGPVTFPQFLDRPQLVTRDGSNRLELNEFNRWGGGLQDDFLRVWGENLAHLLGTSRVIVFPSETRIPIDFRVTAEVISFEGVPAREALLKVRWAVMDSYLERALTVREDVYRCPVRQTTGASTSRGDQQALAAAESEAVVAAMSQCLGDFSRDVASVLRTTPKLPPPAATVAPL